MEGFFETASEVMLAWAERTVTEWQEAVRLWLYWKAEMIASAGRLDVGCEKNRVKNDFKIWGLSDCKGGIDIS